MSLLLLLFTLIPRPDCPPITTDDILRLSMIRERFTAAVTVSPHLPAGTEIRNRLVVGYYPEALSSLISQIQELGARTLLIDTNARFLVIATDSSEDRLIPQALTNSGGVRFVEPDYSVRILNIPNDPQFLLRQWDKWVMYADLAWDVVTGGTLKVAVVDNGVDYTHPDLAANFRSGELGYDFLNNDNDPKPDNPGIENAFHGTHVAGIIAAIRDNLIGVAGWAQIQLMAVRVLNDSGSGNLSDVARGIRWAVDNGARIINMSLGGDAASTVLIEACQYAASRGVLLIAASGNDGRSIITYPARLNECVAVGATNENSELAWFSNYGPEQELVAPGTSIFSTTPGGSYAEASGTSMAAPEVSGVATLILALDPGLSANDVRSILATSAIDMGSAGRDSRFGYGLVNAWRAVQLAQTLIRQTVRTKSVYHEKPAWLVTGRRLQLKMPASVRIYNSAGMLIFTTAAPVSEIIFTRAGTYMVELNRHQRQKLLILD
ncbi:MAG: S8 family peptidase [candidate division WOR-3 bacterium]|nr:S8 family peptidase [candidate division WOR-3 bacterium]